MNSPLLWIALGLIAGAALPLQAALNNPLKIALANPVLTALVSFTVGALALLAYALATRIPFPLAGQLGGIPWWNWIGGGICGALFVTLMTAMAPRLGLAVVFSLIVSGEMLMSLVLDHFGLLSFDARSCSPGRLIGAAFLIGGVVLIERF